MILQMIRHEIDLEADGADAQAEDNVGNVVVRNGPTNQRAHRERRGLPDRRERQADFKLGKINRVLNIERASAVIGGGQNRLDSLPAGTMPPGYWCGATNDVAGGSLPLVGWLFRGRRSMTQYILAWRTTGELDPS